MGFLTRSHLAVDVGRERPGATHPHPQNEHIIRLPKRSFPATVPFLIDLRAQFDVPVNRRQQVQPIQ